VGWGLIREAWGKGYATEAATAAIDWAFATLGWDEVIHSIDPDNVNSQNVARRLGSTRLRQARMPSPFQGDVLDIWGQSRAQWMGRAR
jgi:RimJ/RimL family protein N-acetyltransferase